MALQRLNYRHEAILQWLVTNPNRTLGDCALFFGFTQAWLSQIIHSDLFQARYREEMAALGEDVYQNVGSKLKAIAALALDKQIAILERGKPSERFLIDAGSLALKSLGYLNSDVQQHQHLHLHANVDAELLRNARDKATQQANSVTPPQKAGGVLDVDSGVSP
jgi:hypothetical protein